jgi:RNA polymerase sigma-70 factor (ECF subfamily)
VNPSVDSSEQDVAAPPDPELSLLLKAAGAGDQEAWRSIVDRYARRVYALARSRLGPGTSGLDAPGDPWGRGCDAAEEITQSVFVTVASKLAAGEYTEQGRFEPWLFRVAMNRIRDEGRRRKRQAAPTDPETLSGLAAPSRAAASPLADSIQALREALGLLSDADREIIELRHHASLSFKQISDLLEEPLGTLLARHHRALKKLKDLLTGEAAGEDRA